MLQVVNECRSQLKKWCYSTLTLWSFEDWDNHICDILAIFSTSFDSFHAVRKDNTRLSRSIYWGYIPDYWSFPAVDISSFKTRNHNL